MTKKGTSTTPNTLARRPRFPLRRRESLLLLPPAALLLAWSGLLLASFGAIVRVIYSHGDVVSAPVMGELFPSAPDDATTVLGYLSWYSTLWFELATRWVPFHRELWEVGPWLASLAGIVLVAWATSKAVGRWAGFFVAFVLVCAGDRLLPIQFAGGPLHGPTAFGVCVLDAFLVLLVLHGGRIGNSTTHVLLCALVAAVTGAGIASDDLLIPAGLVPFAAAGLMQTRWAPRAIGRRIVLSTLSIAIVSAAGAKVAVAAMHRVHVYAAPNTITFANWDDLVRNVFRLVQSLADLFNGDFGGAPIGARSILAFVCAVAFGCAVVVAVQVGRAHVRQFRASQLPATAIREAHVAFWVSVIVVTSATFVFSSFAIISGGRYLVAVGYGIVVLAALGIAERGYLTRAKGVVAASLVMTASVVALAAGDIRSNGGHYPQPDFAQFLVTFARGEGLTHGYASYWVGPALTWETKTQVDVYPALTCSAPGGLCTYPLHEISSWYSPRSGERTFVVLDPRYGPTPSELHLPGLQRTVTYGEYTIDLYDHDVALDFGDWRRYGVAAS